MVYVDRKLKTLHEKFEAQYIPEPNSGCWLWVGSTSKTGSGYGQMYCKPRLEQAHRASWMLNIGPIPSGKFVCHKCDNRLCVNPDHLFIGDALANAKDRDNKGRSRWQIGKRYLPWQHFSPEEIKEIILAKGTLKQVAAQFGCSKSYVGFLRQKEAMEAAKGIWE